MGGNVFISESLYYSAQVSDEENLENLRVLIDAGADVNVMGRGITPIYSATEVATTTVLDMLIAAGGADIEIPNEYGRTPLMNSVSETGIAGMAEALILAGANVTARQPNGVTNLRIAVVYKAVEIVELLLDAGADVNAITESGITALTMAGYGSQPLETIALLIEAGADLNLVREDGWTALHYMVRILTLTEEPGNAFLLLEAGADGSLQNEDGNTAFDLIKDNEALKGSDVYLALQAASLE